MPTKSTVKKPAMAAPPATKLYKPGQPKRVPPIPAAKQAGLIRKGWIFLWLMLAASLILEHFAHPHVPFEGYGFFGIYALFGLIACVAIVLFSKLLGLILMRPADYYQNVAKERSDV